MNRTQRYVSWGAAIASAVIMVQSLAFKFSGAPVSKMIFTQLGVEPYGRIGLGVFELFTSILLIIPKTRVYGAILGIGLMAGAIMAHLTVLGINVENDHGQLFGLAVAALTGCLIVFFLHFSEVKKFIPFLK